MRVKFILAFLIFLLPLHVWALGLAVEPAKIELDYPQNKQEQLKITNISSEPIFVRVQADDLVSNIQIEPSEFNLLPEEIMILELTANFSDQVSAVQKTNLSVISQALHQNSFKAASGIKIPLTINTAKISSFWKWLILSFGFLVFAVLVYLLWLIFLWFFNRKQHKFLDLDFLLHHKWWLFKTGRWHKLWRK